MEDFGQIIIFIIVMVFYGLSALSKKMKEKAAPPKDEPMMDPIKSAETTRQTTPNPYGQATRPQPQTTSVREPSPRPSPEQPRTVTPPVQESPWAKMLRELMQIDEPQPELVEIPVPPPKPKKKKAIVKKEPVEQTKSVAHKRKPISKPAAPAPLPRSPILVRLAKEGERDPLRSAVILSEILKRPRCLRNYPGHF